MKKNNIKQIIKKHYSEIATNDKSGCCSSCGCGNTTTNEQIAESIGYPDREIKSAPDANLGLGCGNPTGMGEIKRGDIVLDLGSGAGFDCFLAVKKGEKMYISDIVLLKNLSKEQRGNEELLAGCVGGALLKSNYINIIKKMGLKVKILSEDKDISKRQYQGIPLESLKIEVQK